MKIPTSKAACMSHLLMLVSTGYRHWIRGEMHYSKAAGFAKKMAELYPIDATADMRSWAKQTGRYSAFLIMFQHDKDPTKVMYWLLSTRGGAPKGYVDIHARENLSDADIAAPGWRDQYELIRIERKGKKPTWTWAMRRDYFARLDASAKQAADAGRDALNTLFGMLCHMPMFSGVRGQVIELNATANVTWNKQRKSSSYPEPLKPAGSTTDNPASYLPVMPKIQVWGDLTLDRLIAKMIEDEKRKNEAGVAEANSIARAAKLELEANTSF
jgi:hypothetical protein